MKEHSLCADMIDVRIGMRLRQKSAGRIWTIVGKSTGEFAPRLSLRNDDPPGYTYMLLEGWALPPHRKDSDWEEA